MSVEKSSEPELPKFQTTYASKGYEHTYKQLSRIYILFNKKKITNELLDKLHVISSSKVVPPSLDVEKVLRTSRDFMKDVLQKCKRSFQLYGKDFLLALTAARFQIPEEAFTHNKGLQQFLNSIDRINPFDFGSMTANFPVSYDPKTRKVHIKDGDAWRSFDEVHKIAKDYARQAEIKRAQLKPFMVLSKENRPKDYEMEVMTSCKNEQVEGAFLKSRYAYSWIRLKTPSGDVYSFGLLPFVEEPRGAFHIFKKGLKGQIQSPDPYEKYVGYAFVRSKTIPIGEKAFTFIKKMVESSEWRRQLKFDMLTNNCTHFVGSLIQAASLDPEVGKNVKFKTTITTILPRGLKWLGDLVARLSSRWRQKKQPGGGFVKPGEIAYPQQLRQWMHTQVSETGVLREKVITAAKDGDGPRMQYPSPDHYFDAGGGDTVPDVLDLAAVKNIKIDKHNVALIADKFSTQKLSSVTDMFGQMNMWTQLHLLEYMDPNSRNTEACRDVWIASVNEMSEETRAKLRDYFTQNMDHIRAGPLYKELLKKLL